MWGDVVGVLKEEQRVFSVDGSSIIYSFFSFLSSHYILAMLLLPHLFYPLFIIFALSSPARHLFLLHFIPLRLLIQIWKEFSLREGPQSFFEISDDLDGHFELLFFKHEALLLLIDDLDGLLHPIVEIERKCPECKLNIRNFLEPEVYKILIISPANLFIVGFHLSLQQGCKVSLIVSPL